MDFIEAFGHYDQPQCIESCPVICIIVNPDRIEGPEELLAKYRTLMGLR